MAGDLLSMAFMLLERLEVRSAGVRVFTAGSLVIIEHLRDHTAPATIEEYGALLRRVAARKGRVSVLNYYRNTLVSPDQPALDKLTELTRALDPLTIGTALVVSGESLESELARSFVLGLTKSIGIRAPVACFASAAMALNWLSGLPQQDPGLKLIIPEELDQFLAEALRAA
jgi:hypothetical protein